MVEPFDAVPQIWAHLWNSRIHAKMALHALLASAAACLYSCSTCMCCSLVAIHHDKWETIKHDLYLGQEVEVQVFRVGAKVLESARLFSCLTHDILVACICP